MTYASGGYRGIVMTFLMEFPAYFVGFLHSLLAMPHLAYAAVIALFFGIVTASKPGLVVVPVVAALVYIAALAIGPVVLNHAALVIPAMDLALAKMALAAYVVFLVVDTVVFALKKTVLKVID